jgi:hypothetical protein
VNEPRLFTRVYAIIAIILLVFGAFMIWKSPAGIGGWVTAILATLQLVISKLGELARLSFGADPNLIPSNTLDLTGSEQDQ